MEGTQKGGLSPKKKVRGMAWHVCCCSPRRVLAACAPHSKQSRRDADASCGGADRVQRAIMAKVKKQAGK
jgi:hypothetical protein